MVEFINSILNDKVRLSHEISVLYMQQFHINFIQDNLVELCGQNLDASRQLMITTK